MIKELLGRTHIGVTAALCARVGPGSQALTPLVDAVPPRSRPLTELVSDGC